MCGHVTGPDLPLGPIGRDLRPSHEKRPGGMLRAMFAKYYIELDHSIEEIQRALLDQPPSTWLPGLITDGEAREETLLADMAFDFGGRRLSRRGRVEVGAAVPLGAGLAIPLSWRAAEREGLFPTFDAHLQVAPLGKTRTQLSVSASYIAPLAAVGELIDRALLHRVAEAVIKDFTERVGAVLRHRLGAPHARIA